MPGAMVLIWKSPFSVDCFTIGSAVPSLSVKVTVALGLLMYVYCEWFSREIQLLRLATHGKRNARVARLVECCVNKPFLSSRNWLDCEAMIKVIWVLFRFCTIEIHSISLQSKYSSV